MNSDSLSVSDSFGVFVGEDSRWRDIWEEVPFLLTIPSRNATWENTGGPSRRAMVSSLFLHATAMAVTALLILYRPVIPIPVLESTLFHVQYIQPDELPITETSAGAAAGHKLNGGNGSLHAEQVVRVNQGKVLAPRVVNPTPAKIQKWNLALANLIADPTPAMQVTTIEPISVAKVRSIPELETPKSLIVPQANPASWHALDGLVKNPSQVVTAAVVSIQSQANAVVILNEASASGRLSTSMDVKAQAGVGSGSEGSGSANKGAGAGVEDLVANDAAGSAGAEGVLDSSGLTANPMPGGAGTASALSNPSRVSGESEAVFVPSFHTPASVVGPRHTPSVMVIGNGQSSSPLGYYRSLSGRTYSIYFSTPAGMAVLEFANAASASSKDLTAPEPLETALPAELNKSSFVVSAKIDPSGHMSGMRLLFSRGTTLETVMHALAVWHFRPALSGEEPVPVDVLLGLNITVSSDQGR